MRPIDKAIQILGGQKRLAVVLSANREKPVTNQAIWNWVHRGDRVPAEYCPTIEKETGQQVLCEHLRPDVDWAYVRSASLQPSSKETP